MLKPQLRAEYRLLQAPGNHNLGWLLTKPPCPRNHVRPNLHVVSIFNIASILQIGADSL
jgi:hypothetical protein